jgi:hypothetical protein
VEPEEAQDEHNDDHQADEIDDAVHGALTSGVTIHQRIVRVRTNAPKNASASPDVPPSRIHKLDLGKCEDGKTSTMTAGQNGPRFLCVAPA